MGQHSRVAIPAAPAEPVEDFGVLVGWSHTPCGSGINVRMQSAESQAALQRGQIDARHFLMTRNQALLLARYLLEMTGQAQELPERPHGWRAAWARLRGQRPG